MVGNGEFLGDVGVSLGRDARKRASGGKEGKEARSRESWLVDPTVVKERCGR